MLARVDGAGIVRAGEYALTRLAAAVVQYYLEDEALTRESLTLLTGTLRAQLAQILASARRAASDEQWRMNVIAPLRVTIGDLVAGIERRQRGLDSQQEEVQSEIAKLLQADWFGAVDRCQALLDTTTDTLRELNEVLLRDAHHFVALLQEMQALASAGGSGDTEEAVQRVIEQVDRISAWGSARQRAWSEYYQHVHRYLRDVVRLDPERALSQRLRDQAGAWTARPFHFVVADAGSIRLMRPIEARIERPTVVRERIDREADLDWVDSEDAAAELESRVKSVMEEGMTDLARITTRVLEALPEQTQYLATGRIAQLVAKLARVHSDRERTWTAVREDLEIEDWRVDREPDGDAS
jgi:chromosome partition protein MukF